MPRRSVRHVIGGTGGGNHHRPDRQQRRRNAWLSPRHALQRVTRATPCGARGSESSLLGPGLLAAPPATRPRARWGG
eukprot:2682830-Alexandrium_andersonii.AAC.1